MSTSRHSPSGAAGEVHLRSVVSIDLSALPGESASAILRAAFPDQVGVEIRSYEFLLFLLHRFDDEFWGPTLQTLQRAEFSPETIGRIRRLFRLEAWNKIVELIAPNRVLVVEAPKNGESFDD